MKGTKILLHRIAGVTELLATLPLILRTSSMKASRWERSAWDSPSTGSGGGLWGDLVPTPSPPVWLVLSQQGLSTSLGECPSLGRPAQTWS
eukprot:713542-Pyramimonas_sp.AAC.1